MMSARRSNASDLLMISGFRVDPAVVPHEELMLSHNRAVMCLMVLPDGRLASGSKDHTIKVWDVLGDAAALTLSGHSSTVRCLTVLPDGRLASGSVDKTIKVWDVSGSVAALTLSGHRNAVMCLTVLADGRLASGSLDKTIKVWSVWGGAAALTLSGHDSVVSCLAVLPDGRLASGSLDHTIKVWDVSVGVAALTLSGHSSLVYCLTVLADGRLASGSLDHTIKVWDVWGGVAALTLSGHSGIVYCLTVLPDGRLASGSGDHTIKVWDVWGSAATLTLSEHSGDVSCITVLADGRLVSGSGDHTIKVWDVWGSAATLTLSGHSDGVYRLTVLSDGRLASGSMDETIKVWDFGFRALVPELASIRVAEESLGLDDRGVSSGRSLFISEDEVVLGRKLGQGGFGTVYCAEYGVQTVAVKRYEGMRLSERQAREVHHEVSIMQQLQHACLIRLLGLVQIQESPGMLVMEYAANGSLYDYLHSDQEIAWALRLRMAHELARGLDYLHKQSIVHRDIKSLNVVLDRDLHAKWCDFGLAVLKLHSTTTTKESKQLVTDTLRWMAPELFARQTSIPSTASDIWALGMVYFELASRQIPFSDARNNEQVTAFIREGNGEEVPKECESAAPVVAAIMRRCWLGRDQRPSAATLTRELSNVFMTA